MPVGVEPFPVFDEFVVIDWTIAETRRWCAFKGAVGQGQVGLTHWQRRRSRERFFGRFDVGKEIVVSQQMPDRVCAIAFDGEHTQHAEAALELEN